MKISKAEVEAILAAAPRITVPYHQLVLSKDYQARPADSAPKMSLTELAASILELGVLQNLIVVQVSRTVYEVCGGGRRLGALGLSVESGKLPENYPVPVLVVPAERALMASLTENTFHVPMHPADEFEAFARLIAQGRAVEDVAAAFGVTPLVVKRRMKLAGVSPQLMAQYREGQISLECLMVLASVDDHERQEQAWAGLNSWNRHPDHLRQLLTQGEVEADRSPVAKYVTVKAYEKAGGPTRRDLFSDDDKKVYLLDALLLDQLAVAKLQRKAKQIAAEGWKWVDVRARYVNDEYVKHGELRKTTRAPSEEEAAELDALEAQIVQRQERMDELAESSQDEDGEEYARLELETDQLGAQVAAVHEKLAVWPPELLSQAGCVVYVGRDAAPAVRCGLIRPEDRSDMAQAARDSGEAAGTDNAALVSLPSPKTRPVHSERLLRALSAHRVAAIQAELLERPEVAIAVLTAQLAGKLLVEGRHRYYGDRDPLTLSATDTHGTLHNDAEDVRASASWQAVEAARTEWQAQLPQEADDLLPWLLRQDAATVARLLTFLVATTVTGVYGTEPQRQRTEGIAAALDLDMRKWWQATAASYFSHVSKARITEVVTEAAGAPAAAALQPLKKDAAANGAEKAVAASGWLPSILRLRSPDDPIQPAALADDDADEPSHESEAPGAGGQGEAGTVQGDADAALGHADAVHEDEAVTA